MTALRVDLGETGMKQNKTIYQVVSICLLALLLPAWAYALNLGDIKLMSEPGEPLQAEILLSDVKADEQDSLSVGLADVAGFRWAGIAWSPALNQLQFELRRGADGRDYISIRSDEAVRASSLHFLLKVAWSKGRLFREYTLELGTPESVLDEHAEDVTAEPAAAPVAGRNWGEVRAAVGDTRNYTVVRNDTLWTLARELRPDASVSIQQMMLALLRTNPDAFSYGNINWLKAGEVLWMPSDFELQALTQAEAFAEVLAQNNFWRAQRGYATIDAGSQTAPGTVAVDGGLRLVAVDEEDLEGDGVTATDPDGIAQGEALVLANEQVEELSQENVELGDKLTEAETIIEDLRRLVELKDDELAALQTQELKEQAEPGPGLPERVDSLYDSAVETLSGPKVKSALESASNLARGYWHIALASIALLLGGWLLYRRKFARGPQGLTVPAASVRADFVKVVSGEKTDSPAEEGADVKDADAEDPDFPDDIEAGPDTMDEIEAGDAEAPDETEAGEAGGDEDQAGTEQEDEDVVQNKLDLARAYLELGDTENVRSILDEVLAEGNAAQKEEARLLLEQADSG